MHILLPVLFCSIPFFFHPEPQEDGESDVKLLIRNSNEYDEKKMNFSLPEARKLALSYALENGYKEMDVRYHVLIVGDEYVFFRDWQKWGIALSGIYVNGKNGKVLYRKSLKSIRFLGNQKLCEEMKKEIERVTKEIKK
jgi:hypothetical protein